MDKQANDSQSVVDASKWGKWGWDPLNVSAWRWKMIGWTGLGFGVVGAAVAYLTAGPPAAVTNSALFIAMLLPPYLTVPRTTVNRGLQGIAAGLAGGMVTVLLLLGLATPRFLAYGVDMAVQFGGYALGVALIASLMTRVTVWSEKKRVELERRRAAKAVANAKPGSKGSAGSPRGLDKLPRTGSATRASAFKTASAAEPVAAEKKGTLRQLLKRPTREKPARVHRFSRSRQKKR